jgi:hypothetical protein
VVGFFPRDPRDVLTELVEVEVVGHCRPEGPGGGFVPAPQVHPVSRVMDSGSLEGFRCDRRRHGASTLSQKESSSRRDWSSGGRVRVGLWFGSPLDPSIGFIPIVLEASAADRSTPLQSGS